MRARQMHHELKYVNLHKQSSYLVELIQVVDQPRGRFLVRYLLRNGFELQIPGNFCGAYQLVT